MQDGLNDDLQNGLNDDLQNGLNDGLKSKSSLLQSGLVRMRPSTTEDIAFVTAAESDPANAPFIGQWTREQHVAALTNGDVAHLVIENAAGERIGYLIIDGLRDAGQSICLKRIAIQAKGRGYGKEAIRLALGWLFDVEGAHRVWLDVKTFNDRARQLYASLGFVYEGTLRECLRVGDRFESLAVMSVLRHEYSGS